MDRLWQLTSRLVASRLSPEAFGRECSSLDKWRQFLAPLAKCQCQADLLCGGVALWQWNPAPPRQYASYIFKIVWTSESEADVHQLIAICIRTGRWLICERRTNINFIVKNPELCGILYNIFYSLNYLFAYLFFLYVRSWSQNYSYSLSPLFFANA